MDQSVYSHGLMPWLQIFCRSAADFPQAAKQAWVIIGSILTLKDDAQDIADKIGHR
jgi:hypothetical protein